METFINKEYSWTTVDRQTLLDLSESFDSETKDYCVNDCIKCWDEKGLWETNQPIALYKDGVFLSTIFWSTEEIAGNKAVYIQRLFTPKEYRQNGYFTMLLKQLYFERFEEGYRFLKMFVDKDVKVYNDLNFITLFDTQGGKYAFCLQPMLCWNMKDNNQIVARGHIYSFYSRSIIEYIETQIIKYT